MAPWRNQNATMENEQTVYGDAAAHNKIPFRIDTRQNKNPVAYARRDRFPAVVHRILLNG